MSKIVIDRNLGVKPIYTEEIQAAVRAVFNGTATPDQVRMREEYIEANDLYWEKERILNKKPCPGCDSSQTYCKAKGKILVCRKCGSESEIEYKN